MKKTWGVISETLNRKVKNSVPETMTINGQDCSNREIIVKNFNTFCASIGEMNEDNIDTHQGSHFSNYFTDDIKCKFAFHVIDNNAIIRIIKISKILESVIHEQSSEYFIANDLFYPQQYGFRKNSSTS